MTNNLSLSTSRPKSSESPESGIERLFAELEGMYGSKFADAWRGCDLNNVKSVWTRRLKGYSRDELLRGVDACENLRFPPTLPDFLQLCRPPVDFTAALLEAVEQMARRESDSDRWSHPAIYWAAVKIGSYDLSRKTMKELEPEWRKSFGDQLAIGQWPEIPKRAPALPAPGQTHNREVGRETVHAMLARLKRAVDAHTAIASNGD